LNHVDVIRHARAPQFAQAFVEGLPIANLLNAFVEYSKAVAEVLPAALLETVVGESHHLVADKYRRVYAAGNVHGQLTTPGIGVVHDVVMDESVKL